MPTLEEIFLRVTTAGGATAGAEAAPASGGSPANGHAGPATNGTGPAAHSGVSSSGKHANGHAGPHSAASEAARDPQPGFEDITDTLHSSSTATNGHADGHANGHAGNGAEETHGNGHISDRGPSKGASPATNGVHGQPRKPAGNLQSAWGWAGTSGATAAAATERRRPGSMALVAFREMFRKRALIASRDKKGAVFTLLLPVIAVAFVLVSTLACRRLLCTQLVDLQHFHTRGTTSKLG